MTLHDAGPGLRLGARSHPVPAPPPPGEADVEALRADLAGWTVDAVHELLGPVAQAAMAREEAVPALRALRGRLDDPVAALTAAFVLGRPVERRIMASALPRLGVDGAARLGLLEGSGAGPDDETRALVDLRPYAAEDAAGSAAWWVASDLGELATGGPLGPEHVLGVGGASVTLARCTVRAPVRRVLDVGTGSGVQALHASRHAGSIVATDLSARALAFARLNLALGDVHAELRRGDLLEPAARERFDLVVSNPPFVITPRTPALPAYTYRDAGLAGDDVVRRLVTGVGSVLEPGGVAQLLGNWEDRAGEPWTERVGQWLDAAGLDGWVVQRELQDPAQYAELWMRDGGDREPGRRQELFEAWLDDFASRRVEAIGFGLVTLRRPVDGSPTLRRVEDLLGPLEEPVGEHVAACLAAHEWLRARDDEALQGERLRVAGDVTEERYHRPGEADPTVVLLRQGGGFGRVVRASTALAGLVGACDGELPVAALVAALAEILDEPLGELTGRLLPAVRGLVADGLLLPVSP
ncbi:MAG TPA: methyltransferase [Kineosporiaceae bacterium]|nr:methyltransferase [Kineosporiaceae bacterium]